MYVGVFEVGERVLSCFHWGGVQFVFVCVLYVLCE